MAVLFLVLTAYSCNKHVDHNRGEIILSSEFNFQTATLSGYNFERGSFITYPSAEDHIPDILLDQFRLLDGSIKPGFSSPVNPFGFYLAGSFNNMDASTAFYSGLFEIDPAASFSPSSDTVRLYQVWVIKTSSGNYAKLQVKEVLEIPDNYDTHVEIRLGYYYQPDGSASFPE